MVNFGLNMVLIPVWGLPGAVISTTAATGMALAVLYWINHRAGMRLTRGMIWLSVVPIALCGGTWCATGMLVLVAAALPLSRSLVSDAERVVLGEFYRTSIARLAAIGVKSAKSVEPRHAT
jgi:hypothetical protein